MVPGRIKERLRDQEETVWTRGLVLQASGRAEVCALQSNNDNDLLLVFITVILSTIMNVCLSGYLVRRVHRF